MGAFQSCLGDEDDIAGRPSSPSTSGAPPSYSDAVAHQQRQQATSETPNATTTSTEIVHGEATPSTNAANATAVQEQESAPKNQEETPKKQESAPKQPEKPASELKKTVVTEAAAGTQVKNEEAVTAISEKDIETKPAPAPEPVPAPAPAPATVTTDNATAAASSEAGSVETAPAAAAAGGAKKKKKNKKKKKK